MVDHKFPGPPDSGEPIVVKGYIKWFDEKKGYGFIVTQDLPGDVLLHLSCLRQAGLSTAQEGAKIECEVVRRNKGYQAQRLIQLASGPEFPAAAHTGAAQQPRKRATVQHHGPMVEAIVKWFSRPKGYGFVNRGDGDDIFIHMEVLRACGVRELKPAQRVLVRLMPGKNGLHASYVQVLDGGDEAGQGAPSAAE